MSKYIVVTIEPGMYDAIGELGHAYGPYDSIEDAEAKRIEIYGDVNQVHCCVEITQLEEPALTLCGDD